MESVIARLVTDFETGAISRRQLIQTLALVAVGTPLVGDKVAVKKELADRGLNPRDDFAGGPASGFESYHVKDPDGWDLQISNQTRDKHL